MATVAFCRFRGTVLYAFGGRVIISVFPQRNLDHSVNRAQSVLTLSYDIKLLFENLRKCTLTGKKNSSRKMRSQVLNTTYHVTLKFLVKGAVFPNSHKTQDHFHEQAIKLDQSVEVVFPSDPP